MIYNMMINQQEVHDRIADSLKIGGICVCILYGWVTTVDCRLRRLSRVVALVTERVRICPPSTELVPSVLQHRVMFSRRSLVYSIWYQCLHVAYHIPVCHTRLLTGVGLQP